MKKLLLLSMLFVGQLLSPVSSVFAQTTPTVLINGVAAVANNINNAPYWLSAGQTLAVGDKVNSISVLQYNIAPAAAGGNELQFESILSITTSQVVPAGKGWKVESVAIDPSASLGGGGADNWGGQTAQTNSTLTGNGTSASPLGIAQQTATNGQHLQWNGTAWIPATVQTDATLTGIGSTSSPLGLAQQSATAGQNLQWNGSAWAPASFQTNSILSGNGTTGSPLGFANGTGAGQVYVTGSSPFTPALATMGGDATISSSGTVKVNALESATTSINVSSAAAPATGQILTATSPTTATWQTPSGGATCSTAPGTPGAISGNSATCTGSIGTYFVPPVATATSYTWTFTGTGATFSSTSNSIVISFSNTATSGNLSVAASNACGASASSATFAITVNGTPNSNFTVSPTNPTYGATITLTPTATDNQLYFWTLPGPNYSTNTSSWTFTWNAVGIYNTTLTVTKNGCNSTSTVAVGTATPATGSQTFTAQGQPQAFLVPSGTTTVTIDAYGGTGYSNTNAGEAKGTLTVTAGQVLNVYVGNGNCTCMWSGEGGGSGGSWIGGAASSVRTPSGSLTDRVIVAGGSGGPTYNAGTYTAGGLGGGSTGGTGGSLSNANGGSGGTQSAGGAGGTGSTYNGNAGSLGQGGNVSGGSAGGGGGYYGGGAGGYNGASNTRGGGGGGSNYLGGMTSTILNNQGTWAGPDGKIIITW